MGNFTASCPFPNHSGISFYHLLNLLASPTIIQLSQLPILVQSSPTALEFYQIICTHSPDHILHITRIALVLIVLLERRSDFILVRCIKTETAKSHFWFAIKDIQRTSGNKLVELTGLFGHRILVRGVNNDSSPSHSYDHLENVHLCICK